MALNITLRPFQEQAVSDYRKTWNTSTSHLGIAPTAFGKTVLMGWLAHKMCPHGWRMVILAHREALVEQNAAKISKVDPRLVVGREIAKQRVTAAVDVISASIATLRGQRAVDCVRAWRADGRKIMLITDECHHSLASSYTEFYDLLKPDRHLGLTATPFRGDGQTLRSVFPGVAFSIDRGAMVDDGWLASPHIYLVTTNTSLRDVKTRGGDYAEDDLAKVLNIEDRNNLIVTAANEAGTILDTAHKQAVPRAVCFAINVAHAHALAESFTASGWEAYAIDASTPIPDRRRADARLREAMHPVVLCSCGVLTEGWDVESVNLGILARPTKSPVLCEQMMGRVLRYLPDKPSVLLLDFQDLWADGRMTMTTPWRLPDLWDCEGRSVRQDQKWFAGHLDQATLSTKTKLLSCLNRAEVEALLADPNTKNARTLNRQFLWWDLGDEWRLVLHTATVVIYSAAQGDLVCEFRQGTNVQEIGTGMTLSSLCDDAEMWIETYHGQDARLLRSRERGAPATDKQLAYLRRCKIPTSDGLTKHQAGQLINERRMIQNKDAETGRISFGRFNGWHVTEVPNWYLKWALDPSQHAFLHRRPEYTLFLSERTRRENKDIAGFDD